MGKASRRNKQLASLRKLAQLERVDGVPSETTCVPTHMCCGDMFLGVDMRLHDEPTTWYMHKTAADAIVHMCVRCDAAEFAPLCSGCCLSKQHSVGSRTYSLLRDGIIVRPEPDILYMWSKDYGAGFRWTRYAHGLIVHVREWPSPPRDATDDKYPLLK